MNELPATPRAVRLGMLIVRGGNGEHFRRVNAGRRDEGRTIGPQSRPEPRDSRRGILVADGTADGARILQVAQGLEGEVTERGPTT